MGPKNRGTKILQVLNVQKCKFIDLPQVVIIPVLSDWILLEELRDMDTSFCNNDRAGFLEIISSSAFVHNGEITNPKMFEYLYWIYDKQISVKQLIFTQPNPAK